MMRIQQVLSYIKSKQSVFWQPSCMHYKCTITCTAINKAGLIRIVGMCLLLVAAGPVAGRRRGGTGWWALSKGEAPGRLAVMMTLHRDRGKRLLKGQGKGQRKTFTTLCKGPYKAL